MLAGWSPLPAPFLLVARRRAPRCAALCRACKREGEAVPRLQVSIGYWIARWTRIPHQPAPLIPE